MSSSLLELHSALVAVHRSVRAVFDASAAVGSTLLLCVLAVACASEEPLRFAVTFDDAGGIERGDEVHYKGLEIGEVRSVGVDSGGKVRVEVEVEGKYSEALTTTSMVEIERAGLLGGRQLTVRDGDGPRQALRSGDVLEGTLGPLSGAVTSLRDMGAQALSSLQERADDLQERIRSARDAAIDAETTEGADAQGDQEPPAARQLAELGAALEALSREAAEAEQEAQDPAQREELQQRMAEVQEQLTILREKLAAESEDLRQQVQPLLEDVEEWIRRHTSPNG